MGTPGFTRSTHAVDEVRRAGSRAWALALVWREPAFVVALTALAAVLRLYRISDLPFGLHGDEGIVGLEAHRILDEGWIGPYVRISAGFPAGSLYLIAGVIGVLGDSVFSVRFGMALLGIATVPIAYVAFRQAVPWRIALMAALLLAVSDWHVHLSRVAFLVIAWPFMEVIAVGFLLAGFRNGRWYCYAAAGVATGFAWYAYNAALLFPAAIAVTLGLRFLVGQRVPRLREAMLYGIFALSALLAAWPMLEYARDPKNDFWSHHEAVSIRATQAYKDADTPYQKAEFYAGRARDYFDAIAQKSVPDRADGLGVKPPIDRVTVMLALLGVFIALWRWREPLYALSLVSLPVMALGSILTFDGIYRRTFGIVPFIMLLAGSVLGVLWERADRLSLPVRVPALALLGLLVALIVYRNVDLYFGTFEESRLHREVYYPDITFLSERLAELPDGTYLYFFSLRAQRGHEIRRFLAPKLDEGEDRSREFGKFSVDVGHDPPLVFAFMDAYLETLPRVIARYPGGQVSERRDRGGLLYRTYYFPQGSSIDGDGDIAGPMRAMRPSTDAPPPGASAPPSCVHHERRPDSMTYFRYAPSSNSYAVFRKRASSSGDAIVIWRQDAAGWRELGCAATGTLAAPGRVADMAELGLTADAGTVYYVGAAHVPTSGSIVTPEVSVWERKR